MGIFVRTFSVNGTAEARPFISTFSASLERSSRSHNNIFVVGAVIDDCNRSAVRDHWAGEVDDATALYSSRAPTGCF